jgi:isopenicillin-N epimerase
MLTRRQWIETTAVWSAWPVLRSEARTPQVASTGAVDDEAFWSEVRAQFELAPESTNLVTVVRGVTPKRTRAAAAAEFERVNAFRPAPNPSWKQEVRAKAARFVGAPPDSVALVRNTTEGVGTVLNNWPLERGDEILTSSAEHGQFYGILAQRAARDGVVIRRFHYPAPAPSLDAIVETIERAMTPRTRLVMIGQVVLTGQITPVRAIADRVHARGAKLLIDGVLAVGHIATDVTAMDCDFYAAGFHKWGCGPRATAVFYVRPSLVEQLPPLFASNGPVVTKYEDAGAHPDAHYAALGDSLDFLSGIGIERIRARLFALTARWLPRAHRVPQFRSPVTLDPEQCAGLVAWELQGVDPTRVRQVLTDRRILVGGTGQYGGFFGIPEATPRSLMIANAGVFTSPADVDRLAEAIETAAKAG